VTDLFYCTNVRGFGAALSGTTPQSVAKGSTPLPTTGEIVYATVWNPRDSGGTVQPGRLLSWQYGGNVVEETSPPAGTPAGVPGWCHKMEFDASYPFPVIAEFPFYGEAGAVSVACHWKSSGTPSGMTERPRAQLVALDTAFDTAAQKLDDKQIVDNTDWQSVTLAATLPGAGWYAVRFRAANAAATTLHFYPELDDLLTVGEGGAPSPPVRPTFAAMLG